MAISYLPGPSAYDSDSDADEFLEQHDAYVVDLARKKVPRNVVPTEMVADEIDELAQKIRIKLWLMSQKEQIIYPKAYINRIVSTETVDIVRRHKSTLPLPIDQDGELYQGNLLFTTGEDMQDPADKIEREERITDCIAKVVGDLLALPPCQLRAMVCSLKDQIGDMHPLLKALRKHGVDVDTMNWPKGKKELQSLRASLVIARKKLRSTKVKYIHR